MQRSWTLLSVALSALLISQLGAPAAVHPLAPPAASVDPLALAATPVDPLALAAATEAASWHCALPHRTRPTPTRALGAPVVTVSAHPLAVAAPGGGDGVGRPQPIPGLGTGPGHTPQAVINGELAAGAAAQSFQIPMRAGEVLGVTVTGAAGRLELRDPAGTLLEGSEMDRSGAYPESSPLPGGGNATVDHVAAVTGTHVLTVRKGSGAYQATVALLAPPAGPAPRLYLDFTGGSVDTRIFGQDTGLAQPRTLSPLHAFLAAWGLRDSDEPALTAKITETVRASLRAAGADVPVQVTDSATAPNTWGQPGVSRVIIGGTSAQAGLNTVGISQSVDPGNFARAETALVLLDGLSGPAQQPVSLNHYLARGGDRVSFIGAALGNVAAHEAGHFLGSWHTDPRSRHDLMAPGDLVGAFGFGADRAGGTADDTRPRFGQDVFDPGEGFTGTEDTRNRTRVGLGGGPPATSG